MRGLASTCLAVKSSQMWLVDMIQTKAGTDSDMPSADSTSYDRPLLAAARPDRHAAVLASEFLVQRNCDGPDINSNNCQLDEEIFAIGTV